MADQPNWWDAFFSGPWTQVQAAGYSPARTREEVDFIVKTLALRPGQRVLDVPCGEGRHAIELATRGMAVTAVDFNPAALAIARERAAESGVQVELLHADMRELAVPERYDAAICFYGSFGYFSDEDNLRFARCVAGALREGGQFLIDAHVMESVLTRFRERHWSWLGEPGASIRALEESRWDIASGRMHGSWTFIDPQGALQTANSSIRIYTYAELCALLRTAGFREFRGLETLTGADFQLGSRRLSLIATR